MKITFGVDASDNQVKILIQGTRKRTVVAVVRLASFLSIVITICLLIVPPGLAQSIISGEITGTVTDSTHAVVPNATVTLVGAESGSNATTTTDSSGAFRFPLLRPGNYTLTVTANNFRTSKRDVVAAVGQVIDVPVQLEVGPTTETVEVTATQPALETKNANLATTYSPNQIQTSPTPSRTLTNFAATPPAILPST